MNPPRTVADFEALPTIDSQLPIALATGGSWHSFTGQCRSCNANLTGTTLRGHVTRPFKSKRGGAYRAEPDPTPLLEAWGLCRCGTLTRFSYAFLKILGRSPIDNQWSVWAPRRPWWRRLWRWLAGAPGGT